MKQLTDKNKKMLIVIGVIFLLLYVFNNQPIDDKKEGAGEWGGVGMGVAAGIVAILMLTGAGEVGLGVAASIAVIALLVFGGGGIFSGIAGLLTPDLSIPGWAWIAGFVILILIVLRKGREK